MLQWLQNLGAGGAGLRKIDRHFEEMLQDGRHIFDAAANTLISGGDPAVIKDDLFETDARINQTEQRIRREILVHGNVHGTTSLTVLLAMMSLVKDAERIGDYAKNLYDLAERRPQFDESELGLLTDLKDSISKLLVRGINIFRKQDASQAEGFLHDADEIQDRCDARVEVCLGETGRNLATEALTYRYMKRVASHVGNVVTSVVVPVDKLDFYPDKPESEQ
ncbi:MAG: PhoU domain-containing protein [Pseudomonadota bacterium]